MVSRESPVAPDTVAQEGMRRLWELYDAHYDEIQVQTREQFVDHPEFGPLVRDVPRDFGQERRSYEMLAAALGRGEWDVYWDSVRTQAIGFAHAGISFPSWFEVVNFLRVGLVERLFERYGADPKALRTTIAALDRWLDDVMGVFAQAFVSAKEQVIARQERAIRQLSTPVLQVRPGLLILPIVGALDAERLAQLRAELLAGIRTRRARAVVLDVTGVPEIDSTVANGLIAAVAAAHMMGARVILSGLSSDIAQTLVSAGIDLSRVDSAGDLQSGIERADRVLRSVSAQPLAATASPRPSSSAAARRSGVSKPSVNDA